MSSSVFFESKNSATHEEISAAQDADLVVIYGKKGISFDQKGLENLIEEKTISSISVLRLTSPTPSMQEEEIEAGKLEEEQKIDELGSSADSGNNSENDDFTDEGENEQQDSIDDSEDDSSLSSSDSSQETQRNRIRKTRKKANTKQYEQKLKKEKPEVVGLKLEEFLTGEEAKEVLRNAFKIAGVVPVKKTAQHELLLYVIKNDHNYTPFTSPEQMKEKLEADKKEADKNMQKMRRQSVHSPIKVNLIKKKPPPKIEPKLIKQVFVRADMNHSSVGGMKPKAECPTGDVKLKYKKNEIQDRGDSILSDFGEGSGKEDRESDEDYDVSIRSSRNNQFIQKSQQAITSVKDAPLRQTEVLKIIPKPAPPVSDNTQSLASQQVKIIHIENLPRASIKAITNTSSPQVIEVKPTKPLIQTNSPLTPKIISVQNIGSAFPATSRSSITIQDVKQIDLKKVMASPKGVFTNIDTLLKEEEHTKEVPQSTTATATPKLANAIQPTRTPSKGFTPLVVEAAVSKRLPSQISLQTHQKSDEIASDLIDAFVEDEINNAANKLPEVPVSTKDIPDLVKMLESTETTLEQTETALNLTEIAKPAENINLAVDNYDSTPTDVLPEDLLQHVVDLIEEDKSLKEAIDKQVFGGGIEPIISPSSPPPLAPITQPNAEPLLSPITPTKNKSIIQIRTSHDTPTKQISLQKEDSSILLSGTQPSAPAKIEPIQIVRGNGRVITLPPIEAPTTRAKRRAQAQPAGPKKNTSTNNESELDNTLPSDKDTIPDKKNRSRRMSKDSNNATKNKSNRKSSGGRRTNKNRSHTETEVSESQDDDDPKKLWCICRQPHNNRFMICCDICEDWFHGTCVHVTKAMGIEMEQKKIDWKCPKCLQKQEKKTQPKITDLLVPRTPAHSIQPTSSTPKKEEVLTSEGVEHRQMDKEAMTLENKESPKNQADEKKKNDNIKMLAMNTISPPVKQTTLIENIKSENQKPKKPLIEIKSIETGQFVSLKDLEQLKKTPSQVGKIFTNPPSSPSLSESKHQGQKPNATLGKTDTNKSVHHRGPIKIQKAVALSSLMVAQPEQNSSKCIVCKKPAKPKTIYCSDDCLNKYVRNVLHQVQNSKLDSNHQSSTGFEAEKKKKVKGLFEDLLSMADRKPKVERLIVIERKSGKIIAGHHAPSIAHLKKWLQDNPQYEVIIPGSVEALEIERKSRQKTHQGTTASVSNSMQHDNKIFSVASSGPSSSPSALTLNKTETLTIKPPQVISKQVKPHSQQASTKLDKSQRSESREENKDKEKADRKSNETTDSGRPPTSGHTEPIRATVRRTFKEQLLSRIIEHKQETEKEETNSFEEKSLDINKDDIEKFISDLESFVKNLEMEMYHFFNKDTGAKYRAKYRSLIFNIKDRKNLTLFKKICSKLVDAKQLVRMTPEELASQELAQWRENEAKHSLEMIKKSELENFSTNRPLVLKTHKGEEVIEETSENLNENLTLPLEQVVSMLTSDPEKDSDLSKIYRKKSISPEPFVESSANILPDNDDDSTRHSKLSKKDPEKDEHGKSQYDKTRHKSRDHHKNKSMSRKRSHTDSSSRSRSRSREKRHKSSHYKESHHKDKELSVSSQEREKQKDFTDGRDMERKEKIATNVVHSTKNKDSTSESLKDKQSFVKKNPKPKSLDAFNLVDKILESTKTVEEAANLVHDKSHQSSKFPQTFTPEKNVGDKVFSDSDQEPSSTVNIATPPQDPYVRYYGIDSPLMGKDYLGTLWSRTIHMIDVTTFHTTIQPLSSNSNYLNQFIPKEMEVVGRIVPETVWDYVAKIKKSPNKEIALVRLIPSSESDTSAYIELYKYLEKRNRLGVIKSIQPQIRDFYIYPLGTRKNMPMILQPLEDVDFFNDPYRPDILIGILVLVHGKRSSSQKIIVSSSPMKTHSTTPPNSPKRKKRKESSYIKEELDIDAIIKAPIVTKSHKKQSIDVNLSSPINDADEPYSPGGSSSEGNSNTLPIPSQSHTNKADDDLKKKMEELNRQIAVQEMEIAGLLNVEHSSNVLANISIPPGLSKILASIQPKPPSTSSQPQIVSNVGVSSSRFLKPNPEEEEYDPETVYEAEKSQKSSSSTSVLSHCTEAELLRMIPDELRGKINQAENPDEPPPPGV